jgi:hypothetical protein
MGGRNVTHCIATRARLCYTVNLLTNVKLHCRILLHILYYLTDISDIPSYRLHSFKTLCMFKNYCICTLILLNLFKITLYTTCFDRHWSSSGVLKLFVETAVLAFCASDVRCVVPSHVRVFRRPECARCAGRNYPTQRKTCVRWCY